MTTRRVLVLARTIAAAALLFFQGTRQSAVMVRPLIAVFTGVDFQRSADGVVVSHNTLAMRADGSTATVWAEPSGAARRRVDRIEGASESFIEAAQAKMTAVLNAREIAARKAMLTAPPADCVRGGYERLLRRETLLGEETHVVQASIRKGERLITQWRLRANGCSTIQSMWEDRQADGSYRKSFENRLVFLSRSEPDARLFAREERFREMAPSQIFQELERQRSVAMTTLPEGLAEKDAVYFRRRPAPATP